ncbi:MAG: hypothetical protein NTAFB01_14140 [Nitrospira sp.]
MEIFCLRQTLAENTDGRDQHLLERHDSTYRTFVTTGPYAVERVTRMYAWRADSGNPIKELKEDLILDTFCLQSLDATDASFQTGSVLYNLLIGFLETVLPPCWF